MSVYARGFVRYYFRQRCGVVGLEAWKLKLSRSAPQGLRTDNPLGLTLSGHIGGPSFFSNNNEGHRHACSGGARSLAPRQPYDPILGQLPKDKVRNT